MTVPKRIGPYEVLERLRGGAQETQLFKGRDAAGTVVCIKRVHPSYTDSEEFALRFDRELQLAKRLKHRNIAEVTDFGHDDGHFFVMEFVDGPDLAQLLGPGPLGHPLVVYVGIELCRALAFLHHTDLSGAGEPRAPVIHSDVTPQNVLLGRHDGSVKLADFGLAKVLKRTGAETITRARGKMTYLAPEQWAGRKVSARTDLFALGLLLWRALVGTHPYAEGRPRGEPVGEWIRRRTLDNDRRDIRVAAPDAPRSLAEVIDGLLQPVTARVPRVEEVFDVLRHLEPLDGHAQLARWIEERPARGNVD